MLMCCPLHKNCCIITVRDIFYGAARLSMRLYQSMRNKSVRISLADSHETSLID